MLAVVVLVGGEAHERHEPKSLFVRDVQPLMLAQHPLISARSSLYASRSPEDLALPNGHIATMLLVHADREETR